MVLKIMSSCGNTCFTLKSENMRFITGTQFSTIRWKTSNSLLSRPTLYILRERTLRFDESVNRCSRRDMLHRLWSNASTTFTWHTLSRIYMLARKTWHCALAVNLPTADLLGSTHFSSAFRDSTPGWLTDRFEFWLSGALCLCESRRLKMGLFRMALTVLQVETIWHLFSFI